MPNPKNNPARSSWGSRSAYWRHAGNQTTGHSGALVDTVTSYQEYLRIARLSAPLSQYTTANEAVSASTIVLAGDVLDHPDLAQAVVVSQIAAERGQNVLDSLPGGLLDSETGTLLRNSISTVDSRVLATERGPGQLPFFAYMRERVNGDNNPLNNYDLSELTLPQQAALGASALMLGAESVEGLAPEAEKVAHQIRDLVEKQPGTPTYTGTPKLVDSEDVAPAIIKLLKSVQSGREEPKNLSWCDDRSKENDAKQLITALSGNTRGETSLSQDAREMVQGDAEIEGNRSEMNTKMDELGMPVEEPNPPNANSPHKVITLRPDGGSAMSHEKVAYYHQRTIEAVREALRFRLSQAVLHHPDQRRGDLSTHDMTRVAFGNPRVFERSEYPDIPEVSFGILVDESGSMSGSKIEAARETAIILYEALKGLKGVRLWIYGHTADEGGRDGVAMVRRYVRDNRVEAPGALASMRARYNNADGYAVQAMGIELVRSMTPGSQAVLLVISDGQPAAEAYGDESAHQHMHAVNKALRARGVEVLGLGIGSMHIEAIAKYYERQFSYYARELKDLGPTVTQIAVDHLH